MAKWNDAIVHSSQFWMEYHRFETQSSFLTFCVAQTILWRSSTTRYDLSPLISWLNFYLSICFPMGPHSLYNSTVSSLFVGINGQYWNLWNNEGHNHWSHRIKVSFITRKNFIFCIASFFSLYNLEQIFT